MPKKDFRGGDVRKAGLARAASQTPEQRQALARKAVKARWKRYREAKRQERLAAKAAAQNHGAAA